MNPAEAFFPVNPQALLSMMSDLYTEVTVLRAENERLTGLLAERGEPTEGERHE